VIGRAAFLACALAWCVGFPAAAGSAGDAPVRAFDTTGGKREPCPRVELGGRFVQGGCQSVGNSLTIRLKVRTVFGALRFADACSVTFDLHIAHDGRTWMDRLLIGGGAGDPCNDVRPCAPTASTARLRAPSDFQAPADFLPWRGSLRPDGDGGFVNDFQMCVDTCAGRYDGRVGFALRRDADGEWLVEADDTPVGRAGLTWSGEWPLRPGRFALRGE
jgi:hypothetical protein